MLAAGGAVAWFLAPRAVPAQRVLVEIVASGRFVREVSGTGVVEPVRERTLGFANPGTVARILASDGDRVRAGDVLARLDTGALERDLDSTRSALASAVAEVNRGRAQESVDRLDLEQAAARADDAVVDATTALADARRRADAAVTLFAAGGVSRQDRDAALSARERAERELRQADAAAGAARARLASFETLAQAQRASGEANVERLRTTLAHQSRQLEEAALAAPFDGVLGRVSFQQGDLAGPGTGATVRLVDDSSVGVTARFDENRALELATGQAARVTPDAAPDLALPARVTRVSPVAERGQSSAQVEADLAFGAADEPPGGPAPDSARPGYTVTVKVVVNGLDDVLLVPLEAVVEDDGVESVYIVTAEAAGSGTVRRAQVEVLDRNATLAAVRPGGALAAGAGIAVTNVGDLHDGSRVAFDAPSAGP